MKCPLCRVKESCIQCCGMKYCLYDYFCSQHIDHPEKAVITDEIEYKKSLPLMESLLGNIKSNLLEKLSDIEGITRNTNSLSSRTFVSNIQNTYSIDNNTKEDTSLTNPTPHIVFGPMKSKDPLSYRQRAIDMFCASLSLRYKEIYHKEIDNDMILKQEIYNHAETFEDLLYMDCNKNINDNYRSKMYEFYMCILKTTVIHYISDLFEHKVDEATLFHMSSFDWISEKDLLLTTEDSSYIKASRLCPKCSKDLYMKVLRGNISSGMKGEIWGSKDMPVLVTEYICKHCDYSIIEEE